MKRTIAVWIVVALAALALNSTMAQSVPQLEDGAWILPVNHAGFVSEAPEIVGMGPDSAAAQGGYEAAIYDACSRYGCDGAWLVNVMYCESGGDPGAIGPNGERGLFQFHPQGEWPYAAWYGPYEQIELAAQLFATGHSYAWVCA